MSHKFPRGGQPANQPNGKPRPPAATSSLSSRRGWETSSKKATAFFPDDVLDNINVLTEITTSSKMSFGFGIGDFIATAQLARKLYRDIYVVATNAPEELQRLQNEISNLALSIELLVEELRNGQSTLASFLVEQNRQKMLDKLLKESNATLTELEAFSQQ